MNSRDKLQMAYELAFFPPRLHEAWSRLRADDLGDHETLGELLDMAARLHLALPDEGYASQRALTRLAIYQANSRAFGNPAFIENIRRRLNRPPIAERTVPGWMVRDIGLPEYSRKGNGWKGGRG